MQTKGQYRTADGRAQIEWELVEKESGKLTFSACGTYNPKGGGSHGGQCIDTIAKAYPADAMVQRIARVWERWHLNDMRAGTFEQEEALKKVADGGEPWKDAQYDHSHYTWALFVLKALNLYAVPVTPELKASALGGFDGDVYTYGARWLCEPIPAEIVAEIESWATNAGESLGASLAARFLKSHGIKMRLTLADSKPAPWGDGTPSGHHYRVTMYRAGQWNAAYGRVVFDFWDSAANAAEGKTLQPDAVLSCIASDINCPATFEDFCAEYGYDLDSIKAKQTFNRSRRFADCLGLFFEPEEREELQGLN